MLIVQKTLRLGGRTGSRGMRMLGSAALLVILAAPGMARAQDSSEPPASFNERYQVEPAPAPAATPAPTPSPAPTPTPAPVPTAEPATAPATPPVTAASPAEQTGSTRPQSVARREHAPPSRSRSAVTREQAVSTEEDAVETTGRVTRKRSRVIVSRRSFLDAGTEVAPGERKFLDYAFPPNHVPTDVVTNTGGRTGWHNWPLPGPMFPSGPQN